MARTIRRQPFTVSTSNNAYSKPYFFNQVEFKGLCDQKNDITIDQETFSDVKNVYVDESGVLVSRPSFKLNGDDGYIVNDWQIGNYHLRLYKLFYSEKSSYVFLLRCMSHDCDDYTWAIPIADLDNDFIPKVSCTPIEDKIFVWFAGIDFLAFNTATLFFEDAVKYLYLPVRKLVTNGIETDNEAENFLTDAYIRRHLYSALSSVDFSQLIGKDVSVYSASEHLYDIAFNNGAENILIAPYGYIGDIENYYIDVVNTPRARVYMRYNWNTQSIDVSFDGSSYTRLPVVEDTICNRPVLTRDGLAIVAFTKKSIAKCKLVVSESTGSIETLVWSYEPYPFQDTAVLGIYDVTAYFESIDQFVYMCGMSSTDEEYILIAQWSNGTNGYSKHAHYFNAAATKYSVSGDFFTTSENMTFRGGLVKSEPHQMKLTFCYIPPLADKTVPSIIVGLLPHCYINGYDGIKEETRLITEPTTLLYFFSSDGKYNVNATYYHLEDLTGPTANNRPFFVPAASAYSNSDIKISYVSTEVQIPEDLNYPHLIHINLRVLDNAYRYGSTGGTEYYDFLVDLNTYMSYPQKKPETSTVYNPYFYRHDVSRYVLNRSVYRKLGEREGYFTDTYLYTGGTLNNLPSNGKLTGQTKQPLFFDNTMVLYRVDNALWSTPSLSGKILELDEQVNVYENSINFIDKVPNHYITMNEHYFAFMTDQSLLEVTDARRTEDDKMDFLLYLSKRNEQKFVNEITNLHPLSNTEIGIFTEDEIWYVTNITDDSGAVSYSRPIKSKLPFGCRKGSSVITALDGQAIVFTTQRGITALAPQDFIATTEKTLSYLSDAIQAKYEQFYSTSAFNAASGIKEYKPFIKIIAHKYWILFYKRLDKEILLLDTRNGTWWILTTPYPILSLSTGLKLNAILLVDYLPSKNKSSLLGVPFVLDDADKYADDIIVDTINGNYQLLVDNPFFGERLVLERASGLINWKFSSQKLHLGQINNYKAIKGITLNLKGDDTMTAKLSTKVYRDTYHPEKSDVVEIKINDIRTFVNRLNLLHVINFEYAIENDVEANTQHKFELNSLGIKYEVKERIR